MARSSLSHRAWPPQPRSSSSPHPRRHLRWMILTVATSCVWATLRWQWVSCVSCSTSVPLSQGALLLLWFLSRASGVESLWVCMMTSWHDHCCLHCWIFNDGRNHMETFSTFLALCEGNPSVNGGFPSQSPLTLSFDAFFFIWTNTWVNNRDAGDLRRHRTHYDVTMMWLGLCAVINTKCL